MMRGDFKYSYYITTTNVIFDDNTDIKEIDKFKNIYDIDENGEVKCILTRIHYKLNSHNCLNAYDCKYLIYMNIFLNLKNMFIDWRECEEALAIGINEPDFTFPQELKDKIMTHLRHIRLSAFS